MSSLQPSHNDEIEIFELIKTLWNGKWIICSTVLISCLLASCFIFFQDPKYVSNISYFVNNKPPFINNEKILRNFKNIFYSKNEFQKWKNNNKNSTLSFKNVSNIVYINGFKLTKNEENLLIKISKNNVITINSKSLDKITDVYNYAQFLNNFLKTSYVSRAEQEYKFLQERFNNFPENVSNSMIDKLLEIDRFIIQMRNGSKIIEFQFPSIPNKISPNIRFTLIISLLIGGIIGISFILIRDSISKHKAKTKSNIKI